nr:hypothetical protein [Tanacetum cinerariifolium]
IICAVRFVYEMAKKSNEVKRSRDSFINLCERLEVEMKHLESEHASCATREASLSNRVLDLDGKKADLEETMSKLTKKS